MSFAVYILITIFGFFLAAPYNQHFEIVYQHMYPIDPGLLVLMLRLESFVCTIVLTSFTRVLLKKFGDNSVFVYMQIISILSVLVSVFLKPVYARLKASNPDSYQQTLSVAEEETPLITSTE